MTLISYSYILISIIKHFYLSLLKFSHMLGLFFTLVSIVIYIVYLIRIRKRESISWLIESGKICYGCKENIVDSDDITVNVKGKKLCASCQRDSKLEEIIETKISKIIRRFNNLDLFKLYITLVSISIGLNITSFWVRSLSTFGSFFLMMSAFSLYYGLMKNSRPKK